MSIWRVRPAGNNSITMPLYPNANTVGEQFPQMPLNAATLGGQIYYRIAGAWVKVVTAVKDAGVFKDCEWYVRVGGAWVKSID